MLIRYSSAVADIVFLFDFPPLRRITFRIVPILSAADLIFIYFFQFSMATSCHLNSADFSAIWCCIALDHDSFLNMLLLCIYNHILWHSQANSPTSGSQHQLFTRVPIIIRLLNYELNIPFTHFFPLSCDFGVQICA